MRKSIASLLIVACLVAAAAAQSPAGTRSPRGTTPAAGASQSAAPASPRPSPTPAAPFNRAMAQLPLNDTPHYSPARLDFGTVLQGQSARRTLTLMPPISGIVTFSIAKDRVFWLAEYRELGPLTGGSKNSPGGLTGPSVQRQLKSRITYPVGQMLAGDVQWKVNEGSEIQIDLVFQPAVEPVSGVAAVGSGAQPRVFQFKGQGPTRPWSIAVPACGVFQAKAPPFPSPEGPQLPQTCP